MAAEVIRLPVVVQEDPKAMCSDCDHVAFSQYGSYCTYFNEYVDDPVAEDCPLFDRA